MKVFKIDTVGDYLDAHVAAALEGVGEQDSHNRAEGAQEPPPDRGFGLAPLGGGFLQIARVHDWPLHIVLRRHISGATVVIYDTFLPVDQSLDRNDFVS